jgi:hypothetical protein
MVVAPKTPSPPDLKVLLDTLPALAKQLAVRLGERNKGIA